MSKQQSTTISTAGTFTPVLLLVHTSSAAVTNSTQYCCYWYCITAMAQPPHDRDHVIRPHLVYTRHTKSSTSSATFALLVLVPNGIRPNLSLTIDNSMAQKAAAAVQRGCGATGATNTALRAVHFRNVDMVGYGCPKACCFQVYADSKLMCIIRQAKS